MKSSVLLRPILCTIFACVLSLIAVRPSTAQTQVQSGEIIISELRLSGPGGADDEFIEFYNATDRDIVVQSVDGSGGWGLSASDGVVRFVIPDGTLIPARRHLLAANSNGYSLAGHPAGTNTDPNTAQGAPFTTATPDISYQLGIPEGSGVALFSSARPANQTLANRLDAFGFSNTPERFREGTGFPILPIAQSESSLYRDLRTGGFPKDTNDNSSDFVLVNVAPATSGEVLGAPAPENLSSPIQRNGQIGAAPLDPSISPSQPPNRERRPNVVPNGNLGTLIFRRTYTNNTGAPVTRLRFRVINITTIGTENTCGGVICADVRALSSSDGESGSPNIGVVTVRGVRLEEPPAQPNGGGFNSSLSADFVTLATPLPPGESVNIQFVLGVMRAGTFRFFFNIEADTAPPATTLVRSTILTPTTTLTRR
ncbi:MAG TPA: lamin tail domain-containing protein [Pyrinomonadaceae bacterium]|nr:lamin tail domain-containing protein [Pyrinomonadaceae bacterium]